MEHKAYRDVRKVTDGLIKDKLSPLCEFPDMTAVLEIPTRNHVDMVAEPGFTGEPGEDATRGGAGITDNEHTKIRDECNRQDWSWLTVYPIDIKLNARVEAEDDVVEI